MSRTWTRRSAAPTPPGPGRLLPAAIALPLAILLPACGSNDRPKNRIRPIQASLAIDPFPGSPDPAVYLEKVSTTGDLVTVNVKLRATSAITFDAFNLEFQFDPSRVQVGDRFEVNPAVLGDCHSGLACEPFCLTSPDANTTGSLVLGISRNPGAACPSANLSGDTTLLTLGFIAATTIDPPGSPIDLVAGPGNGDCEILQYGAGPGGLIDLGVECVDQNALMTATR